MSNNEKLRSRSWDT